MRVRLTITAAVSYAALFVILLVQALRGYPLVAPDLLSLALLTVWVVGTVAVTASCLATARTGNRPAFV